MTPSEKIYNDLKDWFIVTDGDNFFKTIERGSERAYFINDQIIRR